MFVARELFPAEVIRSFRRQIQEKISHAESANSEREKNGESLGIAPDSVRLNFDWYDIWKHANLDMIQKIIPEYEFIIFPPTIRTVFEYKGFVPWHQDMAYIKAMGKRAHPEVATCFLPIDDDPYNRPTVEFSFNPQQKAVNHIERPGYLTNQFDLPDEIKPRENQTMTFDLNIGDAIIFGQLVLHRTHFPAKQFPPRNSVEFRFTKQKHLIPGKDYFSFENREFMQFER